MSVIRWNPLREFDDLFAQALHKQAVRQTNDLPTGSHFMPPADIAETDAGYLIELELPGLAAADVAVTVQDGVLSVAGERKPTHVRDTAADQVADQVVESATQLAVPDAGALDAQATRRVHRTERAFGKFERRFRLPKDADVNGVSATASNGVLTVEIARLAEAERRAIEVKVA